jgi:hypothetical protein
MHLELLANSHISHLEKSIVSEMSAGLKVVFASGTPTGGLRKSTIIKTGILNLILLLPNYRSYRYYNGHSHRETNTCYLPVLLKIFLLHMVLDIR